MNLRTLLALVVLLTGTFACRRFEPAATPDHALVELDPSRFPRFADDLNFEDLDAALAQSRLYFRRVLSVDPDRQVAFGRERVPVRRLLETLDRFEAIVAARPSPAELQAILVREFRVFRSTGRNREGEVLFTGYFLPELRGSYERGGDFTHPLYRLPDDLVIARGKDFPQLKGEDLVGRIVGGELKPYATRAEIASGALADRGLELLWVDSSIDAFFLEIQGSGLVRLPDGSLRTVTYAGKNGHRYTAIGAELLRRKALAKEAISMQSIRAWLEANPAERDAVLHTNASHVFFREGEAPLGSINVPVTPGRSIATDFRVFPKGALAFIETERPVDDTSEAWLPFGRFVLDQDTGGAIRTAARVDVYWGSGAYAAHAAGRMKQAGRLHYLLLRD